MPKIVRHEIGIKNMYLCINIFADIKISADDSVALLSPIILLVFSTTKKSKRV